MCEKRGGPLLTRTQRTETPGGTPLPRRRFSSRVRAVRNMRLTLLLQHNRITFSLARARRNGEPLATKQLPIPGKTRTFLVKMCGKGGVPCVTRTQRTETHSGTPSHAGDSHPACGLSAAPSLQYSMSFAPPTLGNSGRLSLVGLVLFCIRREAVFL